MTSSPVSATSTFQAVTTDETATLRVHGPLCKAVARQVRNALVDLLQGRPKRLVVDLSDATDLDTLGMGALLAGSLWARHKGVHFAILPSPIISAALTAAKLDRYLTLVESA